MVGTIRQNADGLHNLIEFSQPKLPTCVLMRLKSIIAFLRYFWGIKVIHADGIFSQSCYPRLNTPIDQ